MKIFTYVLRVLVGAYLIFSGFLKIVDPYGTALKLQEYFEVFSLDIPSFSGLFNFLAGNSIVTSVIFCCLELLVGVALLFGYKLKTTSWVALLMMTFFTFLTFYSAYFERVTDCGCFGEFLKLSPWASFRKNIITMIPLLIIFKERNYLKDSLSGTPAVLIGLIVSLGIAIYSLTFLPVIDFLPYAVGKNLPEQMESPDIQPVFNYTFLDKESNKKISSSEFLMDTVKYEYLSSKILNEDEITPILPDFSVSNADGDEDLEAILDGRKFVIIIKTTGDLMEEDFEEFKGLLKKLNRLRIEPVVFTSAAGIESFMSDKNLSYPYYYGDEKVLKAMARNNPVLYLMEDGTVLGKWSFNNLPSETKIKKLF